MDLIALVGQPGSGKDAAAEYISKNFGFRHIPSGNILRDYINENHLGPLTRENLQKVVTKLRVEKGNDILVRLAMAGLSNGRLVISGLRHPDEIKYIKDSGGKVVAISADPDVRYQRSKHRNREGDKITLEEFSKLVQNENQGGAWNITKAMKESDYTVENNGSYKQLLNALDDVMKTLGYKKC